MRTRAFTLIELLVVLAITAVLAGLLFPVFRSAKQVAYRTTCASNMRQAHLAATMYWNDYNEFLMPMNHLPGMIGNSSNDRTWVQLLLPYLREFSLFRCPSDHGARPKPESTFDQDLVPGDTDSRYYTASLRSNIGYNYLYLAPVLKYMGGPWTVAAKTASDISSSGNTILFVDTVWDRHEDGTPYGGGNWLVAPPCRYVSVGNIMVDSFGGRAGEQVYLPEIHASGWKVHNPNHAQIYGGAWPWHENRMNLVRLDGSSRSISPRQLSAGCEVRADWGGRIIDSGVYPWDPN